MGIKAGWSLLKDTVQEWQEDKVPLWAAALAYYTIFSIAPLLIIAIAIAGAVFGENAAQGQIVGQIQSLVGKEGAEFIQSMLQNAQKPESGGTFATVVSIVTLLFGASGVFGQLQEALNAIWEVKPKPGREIKSFLQSRFLSFAMVVVVGFLLLVSLVLSAVLAGIGNFFGNLFPEWIILGQLINFALSFAVITLLFATIYKVLPDVEIPWSDLWIGAIITSFLFSIGKFLIGLYLGNASVGSAYGAAGSLVVVLLWVYYSAQILLFGAEFTQVYAKRRGSRILPSKHAVPLSAEKNQAGIPKASDRRSKSALNQDNHPTASYRQQKNGNSAVASPAKKFNLWGWLVSGFAVASGINYLRRPYRQSRSQRRRR